MRLLVAKRVDDVTERSQTPVDILRLLQSVAGGSALGNALGTGQVDQVQLSCANRRQRISIKCLKMIIFKQ